MGKFEMGAQMPVGLGLALEQNNAMDYFNSLSEDEQKRIIEQIHGMQSTKEIADFIHNVIASKYIQ